MCASKEDVLELDGWHKSRCTILLHLVLITLLVIADELMHCLNKRERSLNSEVTSKSPV